MRTWPATRRRTAATDSADLDGNMVEHPKAAYLANNTTSDITDGFRTSTGSFAAITKAEYDTNNTNSGESRRIPPDQPLRLVGADQRGPVQRPQHDVRRHRWRSNRRQGVLAAVHGLRDAITATVANDVILARFITGNDNGVPWMGALNTNESEATMFIEPDWSLVPTAQGCRPR